MGWIVMMVVALFRGGAAGGNGCSNGMALVFVDDGCGESVQVAVVYGCCCCLW